MHVNQFFVDELQLVGGSAALPAETFYLGIVLLDLRLKDVGLSLQRPTSLPKLSDLIGNGPLDIRVILAVQKIRRK